MKTQINIPNYLSEARRGDSEAFNRMYSLVYDELCSIAHRHLFLHQQGETLNTTALVHEAYERLLRNSQIHWRDQNHFYALTSRAMQYVLLDYTRTRTAIKRGGRAEDLPLDAVQLVCNERSPELEALDEALQELSEYDERLGRLVELKFFGGLSYKEIAGILGVSKRTVRRDWVRARNWIHSAMQ